MLANLPSRASRAAVAEGIAAGIAAVLIAGCDATATLEQSAPPPRPVSYLTLERTDVGRHALVAGSVDSWKKELIGFEVAGRVRSVREPGSIIAGRTLDEQGATLTPGSVLAELDNPRYRLRVAEAEARLDSAEADARAVRAEVEQAIPSELRGLDAEHERARAQFERQKRLLSAGAGAQARVDDARAAFLQAEARLAQKRAELDEQKARLAAGEAEIAEAREEVQQARIDAADTALRAPFDGEISKVHVIPGGYVEKGQPVVTMQMMDPIKVQVAVSPQTDGQIDFNDAVRVHVDGASEPLLGWVWNKGTVADAATRTFMVTLLVRNQRIDGDPPANVDVHRIGSLWNLESETGDGAAPFFANADTLRRDGTGYFVWRAKGLHVRQLEGEFDPLFRIEKVRVTPGARRLQYLGVFSYRELADLGELDPARDLLVGDLPSQAREGDAVYLSRPRWLLRPGQLVGVDLRRERAPRGYYVPADAVATQDGEHFVYVVDEKAAGEERAARVAVELGATVGTSQGIAPRGGAVLTPGTKLIVDGAHYLRDGDPVNAFDEVGGAR